MNAQINRKTNNVLDRFEGWKHDKQLQIKKTVNSWKFKLLSILIGFGIAMYLVLATFFTIYNWSKVHKIVFKPVFTYKILIPFKDYKVIEDVIISPIVETKELSEADRVASEAIRKQKEREAFIERLYQATRFLESRVGFDQNDSTATHIYCQSIGKVNEVGYFPEGNRKFCFKDEAEQKLTLTRWFSKRLDGMTAQEALCLYVTGVRQPMCSRVMNIGL